MDMLIRKAAPVENDAVAALYRRTAEAEWSFLHPHTPEEDRTFFRRAFDRGVVWAALARRRRVRLWTFQRNIRSRRFYALQGFCEIRLTDGRANEEKEPDVLLEWRRR